MPDKKRIAILGGGMAGLTAAYELSDRPGWESQYDITVYQLGWRLGGKGASGRNVSGPPGIRHRIEEHGLHIWLGFYENAFCLMRRCYETLGRPPGAPLARFDDAFKPHNYVGSYEQSGGRWLPWMTDNPTSDSSPGIGAPFPSPREYIIRLLEFTIRMLGEFGRQITVRQAEPPRLAAILGDLAAIVKGVPALILLERAAKLVARMRDDAVSTRTREFEAVEWAVERVQSAIADLRDEVATQDACRRAYIVADIGFATLRGLIAEDLFAQGFDVIEEEEFSAWLGRYGASPLSLDSAFMRNTYDTVFGFIGGDPKAESISAGTALRSGLRMFFGYKGAFMWLMQAGMGDVVFTPLYEILDRRGVKFAFFHRVDALRLDRGRQSIERVEMTRQIDLAVPKYSPLVDVAGLPCWPSEPIYDQLTRGEELRRRTAAGENVNLESFWSSWEHGTAVSLQRGTDYDCVVLAIPVSSHPHLCGELMAANDRWATMVREIKTMRTMGAQVWLDKSREELGWGDPPGAFGAFVRPLSTYADLSHLLAAEAAPEAQRPRMLTYFCGPMRDSDEPPAFTGPEFPQSQTAVVRAELRALLAEHIRWVWPNFAWEALSDPEGRSGERRLEAQYVRGNIDPSERYVLSVPGSAKHRLRAKESGFDNLILAGDWTNNGLNAGCIEAAVMSGMQAARAIAGYPETVVAEHDVVPVSLESKS